MNILFLLRKPTCQSERPRGICLIVCISICVFDFVHNDTNHESFELKDFCLNNCSHRCCLHDLIPSTRPCGAYVLQPLQTPWGPWGPLGLPWGSLGAPLGLQSCKPQGINGTNMIHGRPRFSHSCRYLTNAVKSVASHPATIENAHAELAIASGLNSPLHRSAAIANATKSTAARWVAVANLYAMLA